MSLEMLRADVVAAAEKVGAAADGVRSTAPGDHLAGVAGALAGGQSAGAAQALAEAWQGGARDLARDAEGLRERMESAAAHLAAQDELVGATFSGPLEATPS